MSRNNKDMPRPADRDIASIKKITQTVGFAEFTDGGAAVGTLDLDEDIPKGALFLGSAVEAPAGFTGDTSATLQIGDGTDADRYSTGTPSVFAAAAAVNMGVPSGVRHHGEAKTPKLTVTSAADWGDVDGGQLIVTLFYI